MIDKSNIFSVKPSSSFFYKEESLIPEQKVVYGWQRSFPIIRKYIDLIDKRFEEEINLEDTYKKINDNDFSSYFYTATLGEELISGVRVSISPPRSENLLPTEENNFSYIKNFPKFDLYNNGYCEITRYAVAPNFRNNPKHYIKFFAALKELCIEKDIKYIFLLVSKGRLRLYSPFVEKHFSFVESKPFDVSKWSGYEEFKYVNDFNFVLYEIKP